MNNFRGIDLNLLVVFTVLMNEQNLTRTGEELGMTQSAVSHALKRLRSLYNDPLFERKAGKMEPTSKARAVYPLLNQVLLDIGSTLPMKEAQSPDKLKLEYRINITNPYNAHFMKHIVEYFYRKAPGITLIVTNNVLNDPVQALRNREYDLHVDMLPLNDESCHYTKIYNDQICIIANKAHPRLANTNQITLEQYLNEKHGVILPRNTTKNIISLFTEFPYEREIAFKSQSFIDIFNATIATDMICTLPTTLAHSFSEIHDFISFAPPFDYNEPSVYMSWYWGVEYYPSHRWLRDEFLQVYQSLTKS